MALHPFLQPALAAAVEDTKGTAFIDEGGNIVTPPTTAELMMLFKAYQLQMDATVGQLNQTLAQQLTTIGQLAAALNGKAATTALADVRQRVAQAETSLLGKADTSFVTQQVQTIAGIDEQQAAAITAFQQALATEGGVVQNLLATQTTQQNLLAGLRTDVDTKALSSTVSTLTGQVTAVRNTVNDPATGLAALATALGGKVSASDFATLSSTVAGKVATTDFTALQSTVQSIPASILQAKQDVKTELLGGAGAAYDTLQELAALELNTDNLLQNLTLRVGGVEGLVNNATTGVAALNAGLSTKALAADLTTTNSKVAANTADIALRATTTSVTTVQAAVDTQKGRVDSIVNTTVPALQADTGLRLLRTGDTATGQIKGPDALVKTSYPTFQQTFGGVNSPRRTIQNLTTGTAAMVALTDTTGQNRTILPIGIQFLLTGSVGLLSSVTVKLGTTSGGAELYTKTYSVLTGLLGKVTTIDQPVSATPLPAGQILYATITGGGQWTCFFDAVFLPTAS